MKTEKEILEEISLGEDSSRQFKEKLNDAQHLAKEMCAMSNSKGGVIYVGVKDNKTITGLTQDELKKYNPWIADAANQLIDAPIYPQTQIIKVQEKTLLIIYIEEGTSKPYCDNKGAFWVKSGSDKRTASPREVLRLFQKSGQFILDETLTSAPIITKGGSQVVMGIDLSKFFTFFEKKFGYEASTTGLNIEQILGNMNLGREGKLTLAGLLLFGLNVQNYKHDCLIRAISYVGDEISNDEFIDRQDCIGTLEDQFRSAMVFLNRNLSRIQDKKSFNSQGVLEIDEKALEEAVVNALLHRDYSKNAVIRLLIFKNRVEIISPGSLPNHLSIENIKSGNSVMRNPLLTSFGTKILPYTGIGSGIPRIIKNHPATDFMNDSDGEQFTIILKRPAR